MSKRLKQKRRLMTQLAKVDDRSIFIRDMAGISRGLAFPDGRFEPSRPDNYRFARQAFPIGWRKGLSSISFSGMEEIKRLVEALSWLRKDEDLHRSRSKYW